VGHIMIHESFRCERRGHLGAPWSRVPRDCNAVDIESSRTFAFSARRQTTDEESGIQDDWSRSERGTHEQTLLISATVRPISGRVAAEIHAKAATAGA
jgi:hypothetical protein